MFSLFKSDRTRWKEKASRVFDSYIPSLQGMAADEIAAVLDVAAKIRDSSLMTEDESDTYRLAFDDPVMVPECDAWKYLEHWQRTMVAWSGSQEGLAKVGALSVWWLSLAAGTFPELRLRGREMWEELERGFELCGYFQPDRMQPKGLEPRFK